MGGWYYRYRLHSEPQCAGGAKVESKPPKKKKPREERRARAVVRREAMYGVGGRGSLHSGGIQEQERRKEMQEMEQGQGLAASG